MHPVMDAILKGHGFPWSPRCECIIENTRPTSSMRSCPKHGVERDRRTHPRIHDWRDKLSGDRRIT